MNQGVSFLTCHSIQQLSFLLFLKPFKPAVWFVFLVSLVMIIFVLAILLMIYLKFTAFKAISFAKMVVVSIVLEKPTQIPRGLERRTEFRIMVGIWMLVQLVLTNGYLGLNITSLSAPLEAKSVTQFGQLAKPGCASGNDKCHIDRLNRLNQYIASIDNHVQVFWQRSAHDESYWLEQIENTGWPLTYDRNNTLESIRNQSIRKFDGNTDFILLPYSVETDMTKSFISDNDFYLRLSVHNNKTAWDLLHRY